MNAAEHELFVVLYELYSDKYYIFAQVHLNTLLSDGHNHASFRHIDEKSVDFVLCDKRGIRPVVAIEYDGSSHQMYKVKKRDDEVDRIFKEAGFPLVHILNHGRVVKEEVISSLAEALSKTS
jgi:very-short-patch-repair endonuclease